MEVLINSYYTLLPIIATSLMGYVVWYLQTQKKQTTIRIEEENKRREANANGTKVMLLYMLERLHTEYKLQGFVSHEQRNRFKEIYEAYHNLGGNGYGTALWEDIKDLEIKNDESIVSPYARLLKEVYENDLKTKGNMK